jgi:hypothetical protein
VPDGEPAGDDEGAVPSCEPTLRVPVGAPNPLLEAALEHAVTAAGLRVAPRGGAATWDLLQHLLNGGVPGVV